MMDCLYGSTGYYGKKMRLLKTVPNKRFFVKVYFLAKDAKNSNSNIHQISTMNQTASLLNLWIASWSYDSQVLSPNVSKTPILAMGCQQYSPLSLVQLKVKHCLKPHCGNGVVDSFGLCLNPAIAEQFHGQDFLFSKNQP